MKERIRKEEAEYLRKRKMTGEISRLADELKRDRQAWERTDWQTSEMVEQWWGTMMTEEDGRKDKMDADDALDKERRVKTMDAIAETRKAFLESHMRNTARHLTTLSKGVGASTEAGIRETEMRGVEGEYVAVEDEWKKRREELIEARDVIGRREKERYAYCVGINGV
jgi:hypothetical protein